MDKNKTIILLGALSFVFAIGVFFGENHRGKGTFFRSWYDDKEPYYGEEVKLNPVLDGSDYYNKECKKMTVVGLQAASDYNAAWVLLEDCAWIKDRSILKTFDQNDLKKK